MNNNDFSEFEMSPKDMADDLFTDGRFLLSIPNAPLGEHKDHCAIEFAKQTVTRISDSLSQIISQVPMEEKSLPFMKILNKSVNYYGKVEQELNKL